jgi:hypothetical protein
MRTWGYIVEIPEGIGGERPSEEGSIQKCERCNEQFQVKRQEEAEECTFHWGKPFTSKANGLSPISSLPILFFDKPSRTLPKGRNDAYISVAHGPRTKSHAPEVLMFSMRPNQRNSTADTPSPTLELRMTHSIMTKTHWT